MMAYSQEITPFFLSNTGLEIVARAIKTAYYSPFLLIFIKLFQKSLYCEQKSQKISC